MGNDEISGRAVHGGAPRPTTVVLEEIGAKTFISSFYTVFESREFMIDPNSILLNHTLFIERLDLILFESLVVLFVNLAELAVCRYRFLIEKINQVRYQWSHLLFLVEH